MCPGAAFAFSGALNFFLVIRSKPSLLVGDQCACHAKSRPVTPQLTVRVSALVVPWPHFLTNGAFKFVPEPVHLFNKVAVYLIDH
jgi:hypothetical protein